MTYEKSVSFRTHLQSNTGDLLSEANISCMFTVRLVISLVSQMAAYVEEGTPLSPSVFICNSIAGLIGMAGAGEYLALSNEVETETSATAILKAAAPLCSRNWKIYVERSSDGKTCRFGVFCGSSDPSSLTVDEALLQGTDKSFPIIRIAQSVTNKVEVRSNVGSGIEFRFNDDADINQLDNRSKIAGLSNAAAQSVASSDGSFTSFLERIFSVAIRNSHGTIIVVVSSDTDGLPSQLADALILEKPVDLFDRYQLHFEENKTAVSVSRLQAASDLLTGFISSDGITILDSRGRILGYRGFIKSDGPTSPSTGGARSRAYASLCVLVGSGLDVAFFRSQDGRMELKMLSKEAAND